MTEEKTKKRESRKEKSEKFLSVLKNLGIEVY
jgi:hypothetical protein